MNILFINPKGNPFSGRSRYNNMYPYSLLFVAGYLLKNGYKSTILDISDCAAPFEELENFIDNTPYDFDIIGFTATAENRFLVWDFIERIHLKAPKAAIVAGGYFFTNVAQQALETIGELDIIVRWEGEITMLELVKALERREDLSQIQGISYKDPSGHIHHNPNRAFADDIEPFTIDDDVYRLTVLPDGKEYSPFILMRNFEEQKIPSLPVCVGRGCPGKCVYCLYSKKKYITRDVQSVINEIKSKIETYDCRYFHLQDPFITKNTAFMTAFCHTLLEQHIDIKWYAEIKATTDLSLLELMKKAGCISVDFSLESASPIVLKALKKGISVEQVQNTILKCAELGIRFKLFNMISLPDETREEAEKTLAFIKRNNNFLIKTDFAWTRIYPGTDLELMAKERGIMDPGFDWFDRSFRTGWADSYIHNMPMWQEHYSLEELRDIYKRYHEIRGKRNRLNGLHIDLGPGVAYIRECITNRRFDEAINKFNHLFENIALPIIRDVYDGNETCLTDPVSARAFTQSANFDPVPTVKRIETAIIILVQAGLIKSRAEENEIEANRRLVSYILIANHYEFFYGLLDALRQLDLIEIALTALEACETKPYLYEAILYTRAFELEELSQPEAANALWHRLADGRNNAVTRRFIISGLFHLGKYYFEAGNKNEAEKRLKQCLDTCPQHNKAKEMLQNLHCIDSTGNRLN